MKRTVDEHEWEGIADELLDFAVEKKSKTCATIITLSGTPGKKTTIVNATIQISHKAGST
jgi:hypothetical protein